MGEEEFVPAVDAEAVPAEKAGVSARTRTRRRGKFARALKIVFAVCALGLFWTVCLQAWVAFAFVCSLLLAGGKKLAARLKKRA